MPDADPITEHRDFFQDTHRLMAGLRAGSPAHRVRLASEGDGWLDLDPPDRTRLRKLVNKAFTPGPIGRLRPRIEQITHGLLGRLTGPARST
jgi:cytochrome P450